MRASFLLLSGLSLVAAGGAQQTAAPRHKPAAETTQQTELAVAESLFQQGQLAEAKTAVQHFLQSHASSVDGYNLLGIVCSNQQDYDCSLEAFQDALKLKPSSTRTHVNLGNLYTSTGKTDSAEKEFRKALVLAPSDQQANYNLALLLLAKGKPAAAIPGSCRRADRR